jgi:hypothetical protein
MNYQTPTGEFPTNRGRLERLALMQVRERFPALKRKRFPAPVRESCGVKFPHDGLGLIPDGWFVEGDHINGADRSEIATFYRIEVEDARPLSGEALALLWKQLFAAVRKAPHAVARSPPPSWGTG